VTVRVTGVARPATTPSWAWPVGLVTAAVACALTVTLAGGPARFAAGAVLALYLPGHALVLALRRVTGRDGVFGASLVVPLSIGVTAAVGLVLAAGGRPFEPAVVGWPLAVICAALAAVAAVAGDRGATPRRPLPTTGLRYWWAALPVLALTGLLAVQVVMAVRHPSPDPSYTEFALDPSGSVLVHSHERATTRFRYEVRVGDAVRRSAGFTLRPGERREFPLNLGPHERADVRLYRADERTPYRRLTP
jgi:uncharacterized membrane protein